MPADTAHEKNDEVSESRNRSNVLAFWFAIALLAVVAYVGAYYALVTRQGIIRGPAWSRRIYVPRYSSNEWVQEWLKWTFAPLHSMDRELRKDRWTCNGNPFPTSFDY